MDFAKSALSTSSSTTYDYISAYFQNARKPCFTIYDIDSKVGTYMERMTVYYYTTGWNWYGTMDAD